MDYYNILEIERSATDQEITKAYRKLALKYHPDKVKDPAQKAIAEKKFKEITEAYEVLSDENKRKIYDQFGHDGLKHGGMGGMGRGFPFGGFDPFGGGFPFGGGGMGGRQIPITSHTIHVDLDAFYFGKTVVFKVNIKNPCTKCDTTGSSDKNKIEKCKKCSGQGKISQRRQVGPGMIMQQILDCPDCMGKCTIIPKEYICSDCKGDGKIVSPTNIEHHIRKGFHYGDYIIENKGDYVDANIRGHIKLQIRPVDKSKYSFKRDDSTLYYEQHLSLREALLGFDIIIKHFDVDHPLKVVSKEIISDGTVKEISGWGMPDMRDSSKKGNLRIIFKVHFPEKLDDDLRKILDKGLPKDKHDKHDIHVEKTDTFLVSDLKKINIDDIHKEKEDESPDEEVRPQSCTQQ